MLTALTLLCLSQSVPISVQPPLLPVFTVPVRLFDGRRDLALYESNTLVAERVGAEPLPVEPAAALWKQTATMRIWRVRDARALRAKVPGLKPVFFEVPAEAGRLRVPLGLVCGGVQQPAEWNEVQSKSGRDGCLPNFWYPAAPK